MAFAVLSKYFSTLSGSVDGLNFADTEFGTVMRSEPKRRNRTPSPAEVAQRDRIRRSARGWASLTPSQCVAWASWAAQRTHYDKKGRPFTPNAYQAYSALATVWYAVNGVSNPAPASPPATAYEGEDAVVTMEASSGAVDVTIDRDLGASTVLEVRLQSLRNANRKPSANGYRTVAYHAFTGGSRSFQVEVGPGYFAGQIAFIDKVTGERTARVAVAVEGVSLALRQGGADAESKPGPRKKAA